VDRTFEAPDAAGYLADLAGDAIRLTAGVPSTTVTSLTSLGTGLPPGGHGIAGFSFRCPGRATVLNALAWLQDPDPREFQPVPTMLERAAAAGVVVTRVLPARFQGSGLTEALAGAVRRRADDEAHRIRAVRRPPPATDARHHRPRTRPHRTHRRRRVPAVAAPPGPGGSHVARLRAVLDGVTLLVMATTACSTCPEHRLVAEDDQCS
jgi:hypothetical protein